MPGPLTPAQLLALSLPASGNPTHGFVGSPNGTITGSVGNDTLRSAGNDQMYGLTGDDTYIVLTIGDRVYENFNEGIDTVKSSVTFVLGDNIENLLVQGSGGDHAIAGVGNSLDNNVSGDTGDQLINGMAGNDVLTGGGGKDIFVVQVGNGSDLIKDFASTSILRLQGYGFTSFAQVQAAMTDYGSDVVLQLSASEAVGFKGLNKANFTASQFQLELDHTNLVQVFGDEFNTFDWYDGISGNGTWRTIFKGGGISGRSLTSNGELQIYTDPGFGPSPFSVNNGILTITATDTDPALLSMLGNYNYTSGLITSKFTHSQLYGVFEIKAQLPAIKGTWPAFWLIPTDNSSPTELDVFEQFGATPAVFSTTEHHLGSPAFGQNNYAGDTTSDFHTYAVDWEPDFITWYFDGVQVFKRPTPADMHVPMYVLANMAIGGAYAPVTGVPFTAQMQIDYIHASQYGHVVSGTGSNDVLTVSSIQDIVIEPGGGSNNTIYAGIDYLLPDHVQTLFLTGTANINGFANNIASSITGNDGNNLLEGNIGNDTLSGGAGNDKLDGLSGDDVLIGGSGSNTLIGNLGIDVATGYDSSYHIAIQNNHWVVTNGTDTDVLSAVEEVVIAGTTYFLVDKFGGGVNGNGKGGFPSVQQAIDAAPANGNVVILIAPGTYDEVTQGTEASLAAVGLYIYKPNLILQGVMPDGSYITNATDAANFGASIKPTHQNDLGFNHFIGAAATNTVIAGLHLQAGAETTGVLVEVWADNVTFRNDYIYTGGNVSSNAEAIEINGNADLGAALVNTYTIDSNILSGGITIANGVGDPTLGVGANQQITNNQFIGHWDTTLGTGRYDAVTVSGDAPNGVTAVAPSQNPTIFGNSFGDNTSPLLLTGSQANPANLPTAAQVQQLLATNGDATTTWAYALTPSGALDTALRNDGYGPYSSYAVANTIDTLNLALDSTPDPEFSGQRLYLHPGDTLMVQSGPTALSSQIMAEGLTVLANANSADLNLTMAETFFDGTPFPDIVRTLTLADYAPGQGANVDVMGNSAADTIVGNSGANVLGGGGGNDTLDGGAGADTAVFSGPWADYTITAVAGVTTVADSQPGRDGTDSVTNIETFQFANGTFAIGDIANDAPTAGDETGAVVEAGSLNDGTPVAGVSNASGNALGNDTDPDTPLGDVLKVTAARTGAEAAGGALTSVAGPTVIHGTYGDLTINPDGSYSYDLDNSRAATQALTQGAAVSDVFTYRVSDLHGLSDLGQISIAVTGTNDAPVASNVSLSLNEDTSLAGQAPIVDPDNANLTYTLITGPQHGALTLNANGSYLYTPVANYNGPDSFSLKANDGQVDSGTATVSLTVVPVNDAPTDAISAPTYSVVPQVSLTLKGTGLSVGDIDAGSGVIAVSLSVGEGTLNANAGDSGATVSGSGTSTVVLSGTLAQINALLGAGGTSTLSYVDTSVAPAASTKLTLTAHDLGNTGGGDLVAVATSTINIGTTNHAPVTHADSISTVAGAAINVLPSALLANDTDADGNPLTVTGVAMGASPHGTVQLIGGVITYTPTAGYSGADSFTYQASDGHSGSPVTGTVNVTVIAAGGTAVYTGGTSGNDNYNYVTRTAPQLIAGNDGNDTVIGGSANDAINGGNGNDVLQGGPGVDTLTGSAGADIFVFAKTDFTSSPYDSIADFTGAGNGAVAGDDVIQLSGFSTSATIAQVSVSGVKHTYEVTDGAFHGRFVASYSGAAVLTAGDYVFVNSTAPLSPFAADNSYSATEDTALSIAAASGVLANDSDPNGSALSAVLVTGPAHGSLALSANGGFLYTPTANYSGGDSFTYRASNGASQSGVATVSLTVAPVNDAPTATAPAATYQAIAETTLNLKATGLSIADVDAGAGLVNATLSVAEGVLTLTPGSSGASVVGSGSSSVTLVGTVAQINALLNTDASSTVSFIDHAILPIANESLTLTVHDNGASGGGDLSATATSTIHIMPLNHAPVAAGGSASGAEDVVITGQASATDVDGNSLTYTLVADALHGHVVIGANGAYSYTPNANFNGPDSFTFKANDGQVDSNTATISLTLTPVNDAPVAANGSASINEDTPLSGSLPAASDAESDPITYALATPAANGAALVNADGTFSYTPNADFNGSDSFGFTVSDGQGGSNTYVYSVSVAPVNDAPVSANGSGVVDEDITLISVLPAASDADGDPVTYSLANDSVHGSVQVNPDGTFKYTPKANFNGPDSFDFTVSDGQGGSNTYTYSIDVAAVNNAPIAANGSGSTLEDTALISSLPASFDVDGDRVTYALVTDVSHGSVLINADGTFTYTPNPDYNGPDGFTFLVQDGEGGSNTYSYSIDVTAVNDAPAASDAAASGNEDTVIGGQVAAIDVDSPSLTYAVVTGPQHGALTFNADGSFNYTPAANYNGGDSFTFKANDGQLDSNTATVTLTIAPVNDAPVATNASASGGSGVAITGQAPATDVDSPTLTYSVVAGPQHGSLTLNANGSYSYTSVANYSGADSFTFKANDGSLDSNTGTVSLTVVQTNHPPVATNGSFSGNEDTAITGQAPASDLDANVLTYSVVAGPQHGSLSLKANGSFTYTPAANYNGADSFTFKANDGLVDSNVATVSLAIASVNDTPVVGADTATATTSGSVSIPVATLLANDSDVDGDTLSVVSVAMGATPHGVVQLSAGVVTYTPNVGYTGTDTFTYSVTDGHVVSPVTGAVTVTISTVSSSYTTGTNNADNINLSTRTGPQSVNAQGGNDTVTGGAGADSINGYTGNDVILGNGGSDTITGGAGADTVTGGTGNDTFYLAKTDLVPTASGAVYDYVTDYERSGGGSLFHDVLRFTGFSAATTVQYVSDPSAGVHDYLITDGAFSAHVLIGYAGAGVNLVKNNDYFILP